MNDDLLAHTGENGKTENLARHAQNVADKARALTAKFGAGDMGFAAGFMHDHGKAKPGFQDYLLGRGKSVPHAAAGALFASAHYATSCPRPLSSATLGTIPIGRLLAFAIAGHHAGLANGNAHGGGLSALDERLRIEGETPAWFDPEVILPVLNAPEPLRAAMVQGASGKPKADPFGWAFFIRMLFSALVDADRLETERWSAEAKGQEVERGWPGNLCDLKSALDDHLMQFDKPTSDLAQLRAEVLEDCRKAGSAVPGLFTLTVPTGGGKTLSSLAFALDHAIAHKLDRIIYVIPFTSIVEQTASVFRKALASAPGNANGDAILEHHSAFDAENLPGLSKDDTEAKDGSEKIQRAAQNWDRPLIVTTAVQFFESLFANKPGRCRKLHNIARSVVILDEAQTLPLKLLRPCLAALNELKRGYGSSIVLCTATQPALTKQAGLEAVEALENVKEIIQPGRKLYQRLQRVRSQTAGVIMSDEDLIEALADVSSGLCIVNNRRHARELFGAMRERDIKGARHLTTAMTAAHRQAVLDEIRNDLEHKRPVRLISTSLIEAGVDISFAAVWRAWAGLDQIAQAAGRCNREGELGRRGGVLTIFEPQEGEGRSAPPELKQNAETAKSVLRNHSDPLSREAVAAYFRELLWRKSGDDKGRPKLLDNVKVGEGDLTTCGIMNDLTASAPGLNFRFADISRAFQMISETMVPVIIPLSDKNKTPGISEQLVGRLHGMDKAGGIMRELQRHIVQVPRPARAALLDAGSVKVIQPKNFADQFVLLTNADLYTEGKGFDWSDPTYRSAESNMW